MWSGVLKLPTWVSFIPVLTVSMGEGSPHKVRLNLVSIVLLVYVLYASQGK